jgi:hypothetical protein
VYRVTGHAIGLDRIWFPVRVEQSVSKFWGERPTSLGTPAMDPPADPARFLTNMEITADERAAGSVRELDRIALNPKIDPAEFTLGSIEAELPENFHRIVRHLDGRQDEWVKRSGRWLERDRVAAMDRAALVASKNIQAAPPTMAAMVPTESASKAGWFATLAGCLLAMGIGFAAWAVSDRRRRAPAT